PQARSLLESGRRAQMRAQVAGPRGLQRSAGFQPALRFYSRILPTALQAGRTALRWFFGCWVLSSYHSPVVLMLGLEALHMNFTVGGMPFLAPCAWINSIIRFNSMGNRPT